MEPIAILLIAAAACVAAWFLYKKWRKHQIMKTCPPPKEQDPMTGLCVCPAGMQINTEGQCNCPPGLFYDAQDKMCAPLPM